MRRYFWGGIAIMGVVIGAFCLRSSRSGGEATETGVFNRVEESIREKRKTAKNVDRGVQKDRPQIARHAVSKGENDVAEVEPLTPEEKREAEEEKLVEAFDALTDAWMETEQKKRVTMDDVRAFNQQFRKVPEDRREECLHRALNLIPDENVMLLAGILMDKTFEEEILELVYNDILNRDEDVKKPILQEIFKDKTHPCWADTAWILDVTGELPDKKSE